jgi:hypothetical protein
LFTNSVPSTGQSEQSSGNYAQYIDLWDFSIRGSQAGGRPTRTLYHDKVKKRPVILIIAVSTSIIPTITLELLFVDPKRWLGLKEQRRTKNSSKARASILAQFKDQYIKI